MISMNATVRNAQGIHCRPAAVIIKEANGYPGIVKAHNGKGESDLRSVMGLLALGLDQGSEVTISVTGPSEEEHCRKFVALFETHFDFPPRKPGEPPAIPPELQ